MEKKPDIFSLATGVKCVLFVLMLVAGLILNTIPSLRPTESHAENRTLNRFPSFTWEKLANGDYFSHTSNDPDDVGISQWFADTFPFREALATAHKAYETLYGIQTTRIHGDIGPTDDIPDVPLTSEANTSQEIVSSTDTVSPEDPTPTPETIGGVLVVGDTAYEYYNFNTAAANTYIGTLNRIADRLEGKATVYDMIVPTSVSITLSDTIKESINSSDQLKAINYMYTSMSEKVGKIDVYSTLYAHRNDYIYFRTDHHWTPTGAFYAYQKLMTDLNKTPVDFAYYANTEESTNTMAFDGFLGTLYSATKSAALAANPDVVTAYVPKNCTMTIYEADGVTVKSENFPIIRDPSTLAASTKYWYTFIGGDTPLCCIRRNDADPANKSVCVLVKESYGNCFAPLLAANYDEVYVVDYRYLTASLTELVERVGATEVIFLNNISATRNANLMNDLSNLVDR